jgi:pimeloyl-ACP methyl ester carboxylesterase
MPEPTSSFFTTNGVQLHVASVGPHDGRPLILLHGFPEFWYGWHQQLGPLAEAGYRVVVPDQRGYNLSDKPPRIASYCLDILADDIAGLVDFTGHRSAAIVGHDWGGIVAWWTALRHPDRVERVAVLNAPHPAAFRRVFFRHPSQFFRSWYVFVLQIPRLPEIQMRANRFEPLVQTLGKTSRLGTFTESDFARYREAWAQPGALTTMVHWYRAALRCPPRRIADPRVRQPTLLIWGLKDRFMHSAAAQESLGFCDHGQLELIDQATHWVQHEESDRVNRLLLDFLSRS